MNDGVVAATAGWSQAGRVQNPTVLSAAWRVYVRAVVFGLAILFTLGAVGHLISATLPWMLRVTPVFIALIGVLVLAPSVVAGVWKFVLWAAGTYGFALLVDQAGAASGTLFGEYAYGATLGWTWRGVPVTISLNWMLVLNGAVYVASRCIRSGALFWRRPAVALLAALIVIFYDLLLEPVAIRLDYWHWTVGLPPVRNFAGIFVCAAVFALLHPRQNQKASELGTTGRLAGIYVGLQMAFFLALLTGWFLQG